MKPNKAILITRPNHDRGTTYLYHWSETIIEKAKAKQIPVLDLAKDKANIQHFQSYIKKHNPILILFNGHGSQSLITGYKRKFWLVTSPFKSTRPLADDLAKLFLEPSNLIPLTILKGKTTIEAHNRSKATMLRNLSFMLSTKASQAQKDATKYMWYNIQNQIILGDGGATI